MAWEKERDREPLLKQGMSLYSSAREVGMDRALGKHIYTYFKKKVLNFNLAKVEMAITNSTNN